MKWLQVNSKTCLTKPTALAIGNFDGVHLGHRQLINQAVEWAKRHNTLSGVLTFNPHPLQVLSPNQPPQLLASWDLKRQLIEQVGPDLMLEIPFTKQLAAYSPRRFVKDILVDQLNTEAVFIGYNYSFGARGAGTPQLLEELAKEYGFCVCVIPPIKVNQQVVSSSVIRDLLRVGKVEKATEYLGHRYTISGMVVSGEKLGRKLGFPTANIEVADMNVLIPTGVYAVKVFGEGFYRPGVMNIGYCPTFGKEKVSVEVHLLDFNGDLYDHSLKVEIVKRLREEKSFASVDQLVEQIRRDVQQSKQVLA